MVVDLDPSTTIGAIFTLLAGAGLWIRKERASWAQNNELVAKTKYTTKKVDNEIEYLRQLNDELNDLRKTVITHTNKIASLESLYVPVKQHIDNLVLCELCQISNKPILTALDNALAKVSSGELAHGHNH